MLCTVLLFETITDSVSFTQVPQIQPLAVNAHTKHLLACLLALLFTVEVKILCVCSSRVWSVITEC